MGCFGVRYPRKSLAVEKNFTEKSLKVQMEKVLRCGFCVQVLGCRNGVMSILEFFARTKNMQCKVFFQCVYIELGGSLSVKFITDDGTVKNGMPARMKFHLRCCCSCI